MAIHGFDFYSAEIVVSTIGDIHRFPDWRHLSSYVGLVPTVRNSGDTVHHGRITKRGSRDARWILSEVGIHARRCDPHLQAAHRRIAKRRGAKVAQVAVGPLSI